MKISKDFDRSEFACKCGCGFDTVDIDLARIVQDLRDYIGGPVKINSGCRCEKHNNAVGGSDNSQHLLGRAADVCSDYMSPYEIHKYLINKYPKRFGIGLYDTFVHVDSRNEKARW